MQATFYCRWCLSRKPIASGYKETGHPRRRKCLQCCGKTTPPVIPVLVAAPVTAPHPRSTT